MNAAKTVSPRDAFVIRIERLINEMDMTQEDLANKLGYTSSNLITMFKKGRTRVPLDKVGALAEALGVDGGELVRQWLEAYEPEAVRVLNRYVGSPLSRNERSWIEGLRKTFGSVPAFDERYSEPLHELARPAA